MVRRSQVMDALQYAASVDNVDESHAGGFDDLLFELCQSRARRDSIMRGEVDASRQWLQTFSYIDPTVPSQELDELDRAYKYFNEEGLSRKGRIPFCRCTPPRPARECNYLSWKKTCSEINVQIQVGQKLLEKGEDEKALQWGHKVFGNVESLASARAPSRYGEVLRARANILQADIYFGKKLYKEALHKYELALGMLKTDSKTLQQHNAAAAASTNSTMRPHKIIVEEYQAKPLYYAAVCNKFLSQLPAAEYYIDSLVNCKATARDANGDSVTVTNPEVERWRVEAVTLQPEIKALVEANSKTIVTDSEKEAALLGQVVIGSRPSPLKCALEKASWKQVGDCRDADGDARNSVHIIPRLRWAIIWVRNELLIWDYCNSRVVHWLKLGERSSKECTETHLVDLKEKGVLCYFSNCLHLNEIMCIDLTQLPPGGSSDASVATVAFLGMPENLGKMHNLVSNLNGGWAFAHNGDLRISDSDPWKFAVSYSKKIAFAKVGGLGVGIFADIKAGTRLGPLNFHTSTPTIYLSHDQLSFSILFLAAPHQDCVITYGQRIAVWDCFSPKKSGLIPRTQVVDLPHTASVVCSREFIFAAAFSSGMTLPKEGESNDPMDPSNIGIWDIAKCRRIATLKPFKDGGAKQRGVYELALKRAPNGSKNGVLCSSHNNGTINIWQFVDEVLEQGSSLRISHLMCHRVDTDAIIGLNLRMLSKPFSTDESSVIPPSDPSKLFPAGKELAFTEDLSVCVASMDTLLVLHLNIRDRKEGYAKSELLTRNCALPACGEWNHVEMPMCSVCRKSFYCNERHQRLDWKRHKLECKPRSQQV